MGKELAKKNLRFGTDGWRGIIADEFTFANLRRVSGAAAQVLAQTYGHLGSKTIMVGYDRRFLSPEFALCVAQTLADLGFIVQLSESFCSTPAMSWAAFSQRALGALVVTASHNPPLYSGLKIKGAFGGSVSQTLTQAVEQRLDRNISLESKEGGAILPFNPWQDYCRVLGTKVNVPQLQAALQGGRVRLLVNVMHGAAATGITQILGQATGLIEVNGEHDPLFGGGSPEPIPRYLGDFCARVKQEQMEYPRQIVLGLVFDGDGDRIAAVDGNGTYHSSQVLIPILIEHLTLRQGLQGEVIKTISGSDLIPKVAALYHLPLWETAIGYKYIAERMLSGVPALLGGEESGGIGFGNHIPERDALLSALYTLEAVVQTEQDLPTLYRSLQDRVDFRSYYDRIDLTLPTLGAREQLFATLAAHPFTAVADREVTHSQNIDGFKFRLQGNAWLLIRFSGTEPVLRLYSEGSSAAEVAAILGWVADWVNRVVQESPKS